MKKRVEWNGEEKSEWQELCKETNLKKLRSRQQIPPEIKRL